MDSSITEITGIKYTSNLKDYSKITWDRLSLPEDTTIDNEYSFIYWIKNPINTPYDMDKIYGISDLEDGHTYYSIACNSLKVSYIINTNNVTGYSYNSFESGYAKYQISNGTSTPTYYSDVIINPIPTYNIHYTHTNEMITMFENDVLTLTEGPLLDNHVFEYWLINDKQYNPYDQIIIVENLTITPVYKEVYSYTVSFSNSLSYMSVIENEVIILPSVNDIEGYEFEGYLINGKSYNINDEITITDNTHIELVYNNISTELISEKENNNLNYLYIIIPIIIGLTAVSTVTVIVMNKRKR